MHLQYRDLKLIQASGRPDQDNKDILNGIYDNSETPLTYKERMAKIFSDWRNGDILVIADQPLKHPKKQGDTLVEMTREEVCATGDLSALTDGEVYQDGTIIKKEKPKGVDIQWEYPNWVDKATEEEIKNYIGKYIGDELLMKVLAKGCEVEIAGEKHTQILDDRKLVILSSTGTGVLISQYSRQGVNSIPWSFNDDGSDSTILTLEQFSQLALQCLDYAMKCYTVADILKAQNRLDVTLEEFLEELKKLETSQVAMMSMSAKTPSPLYTVQQTINKYNKLNNVLDCEDMKDVGVFTDYRAYMKELFEYESKLNKGITVLSDIPVPSDKLQAYFNELEEQGRI